MKKILLLLGVSVLGGLLTLGGYKLFIEESHTPSVVETKSELPVYVPTSNVTNALNVGDSMATNFVTAAEKSLDAVVHVKNTAVVTAPMSISDFFYGRSNQREQVAATDLLGFRTVDCPPFGRTWACICGACQT